ncbi:MAG: carbohydrate porin [Woeseiaceae bacterium]|nr:carbohydrate porin [Woeseiaceae bacterium]
MECSPGHIGRCSGDPEDPGQTEVRLSSDEGALVVGEFQRQTNRSRLLMGAWTHTEKTDLISEIGLPDARRERSSGVYLRGEMLVSDKYGELSAFGRFGLARESVNLFPRFASGGLYWREFSDKRPDDEAGAAFAWAHASDSLGRAVTGEEVAVELTYRWQVNERFSVQPDIQYVINPGLNPFINNALVAEIRIEGQFLPVT